MVHPQLLPSSVQQVGGLTPHPPPLLSISNLEAWDTLGRGGGPFYLFWANFKCYILQSFC